jgi:Kelch motif.
MNVPRRALAAVTLPDGIYAIGGFDGENYLSTVERYDEQTNEWVFVSPMNYARCTLSAVSSGDFQHIYVFGGFDNGPLKTVEK